MTFAGVPSSWHEPTDSLISQSSCGTPSTPTQIVRLFLAINLPPEVRHAIAEAAAPLRAAAPELSWIREPQIHLTVKFLGEQPDEIAPKIIEAMNVVGSRNRVVDVEIGGVGAFPNFRRPRVVWIGVSPEPKLELLHHDVESACESLGLPLDGKPFRPHLTLARVKPRAAKSEAMRNLARAARNVSYVEEVVISSIDLMESELTTVGSRYRLLSSSPLKY
jgi:RNA 2',3'-cyclic 3'-phosphodiesterase